jgi:alkyl hydroperoxide reductase subunit F
MYDLIVVGGGPAGLTSTIYAIRKRLNVLLITKDLGGKTNFRLALPWVEDYQVIKGLEIVNKFKSELEYLEFARHMEPADKIIRKEKVSLSRHGAVVTWKPRPSSLQQVPGNSS